MTLQLGNIAVFTEHIDGAVTHAVALDMLVLRFGKGCHLTLDRHLACLDVVEALHRMHASLVVEDDGVVLVAAVVDEGKRQRFCLGDDVLLGVKQCHALFCKDNELVAHHIHLTQLLQADFHDLGSPLGRNDQQVP